MTEPYRISNGWFSEVYGLGVLKRDLDRPDMGAFNYPSGRPFGIAQHYTAGCGTDLSGVANARGYVICTFSIDRAGAIYQYVPLFRGAWHAQDLSENYVGIEHSALPGNCALTDVQRASSIKLNAAVVVAVKDLKGIDIPLRHIEGCVINAPGFKEHADGAIPTICDWDDKVHTDNPVSWWAGGQPGATVNKGWDVFLGDINEMIQTGGEMADDRLDQYWQGIDDFQAGKDKNPDWAGPRKRGWDDAKRFESKPEPTPAGGTTDHTHTMPGKTGNVAT